ncbi:alpha/beta hydrolase family protein [Amycolatopsis alkalitolerans]|uniref:Lipase n=1 Tax=Amycolatopsis alkalitolerans TaxID=2547244 RepID=A0A5C4LU51_9PSEU|nr:lipase [Amycolatopsis alkalitolerans]TNC22406.1 lipase [Amycolatopsis alkalitolerans]
MASLPAPTADGLPLVVLSPGFTKPRSTLTALAEDLASHGYVVAAVDHTYENVATTFPDGRVTTCLARETPARDEAFWEKVVQGRAADASFVLDELSGPKWTMIDTSRIGMAGHSIGGASAIPALLTDSRVLAGIDIDGTTHAPIPRDGLSRPFLFLGRPGPSVSWQRDWPLLTGWKRWLVVAGAVHPSFTDVGLLAEQFGLGKAELPASRATEITRGCVRGFFDMHLRGRPETDLAAEFPEVNIQQ